jgi:hypothetical protein
MRNVHRPSYDSYIAGCDCTGCITAFKARLTAKRASQSSHCERSTPVPRSYSRADYARARRKKQRAA